MTAARLTGGVVLAIGLADVLGVGVSWAKVDADPAKDYHVTPEQGPWMICAASYTGELAAQLAHELVLEIRTRYDLPAYVYNRGKEEREKQRQELEERRRKQMEYLEKMGLTPDRPPRLRHYRIEEQYAVLIGGYKDIETARKALDRVKKLEPPKGEVVINHGRPDQRRYPLTNLFFQMTATEQGKEPEMRKAVDNPFVHAFVAPNPTIPRNSQTSVKENDEFLRQLNADEPFSLYRCPKPWTLAVQDFRGPRTIQPASAPSSLLDKLLGRDPADQLDATARQAREVARVLREMKFEAYVLHTRYGSVVAVGGYDSPNDPKLLANQQHLANMELGPVVRLFTRPMPMEVPR
jgi:hypothetical protein